MTLRSPAILFLLRFFCVWIWWLLSPTPADIHYSVMSLDNLKSVEDHSLAICGGEDMQEDHVICGNSVLVNLVVDSTFLRSSRTMCSHLQEQFAEQLEVCDPSTQDCDEMEPEPTQPVLLLKQRQHFEGVIPLKEGTLVQGDHMLQIRLRSIHQPMPDSQEYSPLEPPPRPFDLGISLA